MDNDEIDRHLADLSKSDVVTEGGAADAAERREDLLSNAGLLLPREGGRATFYHLSFQEFLAAGRLRRMGEQSEAILQRYADPNPALLLADCLEVAHGPLAGRRANRDHIALRNSQVSA